MCHFIVPNRDIKHTSIDSLIQIVREFKIYIYIYIPITYTAKKTDFSLLRENIEFQIRINLVFKNGCALHELWILKTNILL